MSLSPKGKKPDGRDNPIPVVIERRRAPCRLRVARSQLSCSFAQIADCRQLCRFFSSLTYSSPSTLALPAMPDRAQQGLQVSMTTP